MSGSIRRNFPLSLLTCLSIFHLLFHSIAFLSPKIAFLKTNILHCFTVYYNFLIDRYKPTNSGIFENIYKTTECKPCYRYNNSAPTESKLCNYDSDFRLYLLPNESHHMKLIHVSFVYGSDTEYYF